MLAVIQGRSFLQIGAGFSILISFSLWFWEVAIIFIPRVVDLIEMNENSLLSIRGRLKALVNVIK